MVFEIDMKMLGKFMYLLSIKCFSKPVPLGLGEVKRDLSLCHNTSHIYPRWRPFLVPWHKLYTTIQLVPVPLVPLVPKSGSTRPWIVFVSYWHNVYWFFAYIGSYTLIGSYMSAFMYVPGHHWPNIAKNQPLDLDHGLSQGTEAV